MSRTEPGPDFRTEPDPVLETIMRIVAKVAKISPDELRPENPVTGITNVDSILLLEIVALSELELGIEISRLDHPRPSVPWRRSGSESNIRFSLV